MKRQIISPEYKQLLDYIVTYRRSRYGKGSPRKLLEQLILAYAKQVVSGITDHTVHGNMLALINRAEEVTLLEYDEQIRKQKELRKKAIKVGIQVD